MPNSEALTWLIMRSVRDCASRATPWVPLMTITRRLALRDDRAVASAIAFGRDERWLEESGAGVTCCLRLTDLGWGLV
jgi:hypothetical protein